MRIVFLILMVSIGVISCSSDDIEILQLVGEYEAIENIKLYEKFFDNSEILSTRYKGELIDVTGMVKRNNWLRIQDDNTCC